MLRPSRVSAGECIPLVLSSIDAVADFCLLCSSISIACWGKSCASLHTISPIADSLSSSRRLLPSDHPELPTKQRRCPFHPIHHRLAPWRCLQYSGRCPAGRPADHGTIPPSITPRPNSNCSLISSPDHPRHLLYDRRSRPPRPVLLLSRLHLARPSRPCSETCQPGPRRSQ